MGRRTRAAMPARAPRRRSKAHIRLSMQWVLDAMTGAAAFVRDGRMDIGGYLRTAAVQHQSLRMIGPRVGRPLNGR